MKKTTVLLFALILLTTAPAFAMHKGEMGGEKTWGGLEEKFCYKADMLKEYGEEAGLTEQQIQEIKDLKYTTQKQVIEMDAKIKSIKLDLWKAIYEKPADQAKIDSLIDQKYEVARAKAKLLAAGYVKLCNMPTKEQWKKIKAEMTEKHH